MENPIPEIDEFISSDVTEGEFKVALNKLLMYLSESVGDDGENYLEKSGGTMTGAITFADGQTIDGYADTALSNITGNTLERVSEIGDKFVRYESGLQICFGAGSYNTTGTTVTFPRPFKLGNSYNIVTNGNGYSVNSGFSNQTASTIKLHTSSASGAYATWIAIGQWK